MNRKLFVLAVLAVAAAAVAGLGWAAIPAANGTITACMDNKGALKVIDAESGAACPASQQQLDWNVRGPQGPAGPQGPQGPAGQIRYLHVAADGTPTPMDFPWLQSASRSSTGVYDIYVNAYIHGCRLWPVFAGTPRVATVGHVNSQFVRVKVYDLAGNAVNNTFALFGTC